MPRMLEKRLTWGEAVKQLLADPVNARHAGIRPKGYSDAEWLGALYQARLLGYRFPPTPRKLTS